MIDLQRTELARRCMVSGLICAQHFKLPTSDVFAERRRYDRSDRVRMIAMYLVHVAFGHTYEAIGSEFRRDRTTVSHACRTVEDRRDDADFDALLDMLQHRVVSGVQSSHGLAA